MFDLVLEDIEAVFASATWQSNSIPTFPENYQGNLGNNLSEYVRMNVLPSSSKNYAYDARKQLDGLLAVKIFVKAGNGQGRTMEIADILNTLFENTTLTNGTKLGTSFLQIEGLDPANKSLYSASYLIPFTKFGE